MLGFFHPTSQWRRVLQVYNALTFSLAAFELANNPAASGYEMGSDMLIHLATFYSLGKVSVLSDLGCGAVNLMRIGAIYAGATAGVSAFSIPVNALDTIGHFVNAGTLFFGEEPVTSESTPGGALSRKP